MGVGLFIFVTIVFLLLFIFGIWLLVVIFKKEETDSDSTIALNFLSNYSNGRFLGIERNTINAKNGRIIKEIEPKDILVRKKDKIKILNEPVIIGKSKLLSFPRGTLSKDRNINMYLPIHPSDLPENLKNTEIGIALMIATGLKDLKDTEVNLLREGGLRKDELLKKIGDGELSKEFIVRTEEYVKDFLRATISAKEDKNKSSTLNLTPTGMHNE